MSVGIEQQGIIRMVDLVSQSEASSGNVVPSSASEAVPAPGKASNQRALSLSRSAIWAFAGNTFYRTSQWAMLVVLGNYGSPDTIGEFGLALAVCSPIVMFALLQLSQVMATDAKGLFSFQTYLFLRWYACMAALVAIVTISFFLLQDVWLVVILVAVAKAIEAIGDIYQGVLRQADRMDLIARVQIARGLLAVLPFAVVFIVTRDLSLAVGSMVIMWLLALLLVERPLAMRYGNAKLMRGKQQTPLLAQICKLAHRSWPLGFASLLIALYAFLPHYALKAFWGKHELGVFVAIASIPMIVQTAVQSASQAAAPRFGQYFCNQDALGFMRLYRRTLIYYFCFGVGGVVTAWLFGETLLAFVFSAEIAERSNLLLYLMGGTAISFVTSYQPAFLALNQFNIYSLIWGASVIVLIVAGSLLIPGLGCQGAAISILLANSVRCVLIHVMFHRLVARFFSTVKAVS